MKGRKNQEQMPQSRPNSALNTSQPQKPLFPKEKAVKRTFAVLFTLVFLAACAQGPQPSLQTTSVSTEYVLEKLPTPSAYVNPHGIDISDDGRVILGKVNDGWFLWSAAQGFRKVSLAGSYPLGLSGDGSTVMGYRYLAGGTSQAFRWTSAGGVQNLGLLPGDSHSHPNDVNFDGSVIVGNSENNNYEVHAFRWTASTGIKSLNVSSDQESCATDVSADGRTVAGQSKTSGTTSVFRWTTSSGRQSLGSLPDAEGSYLEFGCIYGAISSDLNNRPIMSDDGNVIVGLSAYGEKAFRWTPANGMQAIPIAPRLLSVSRDGEVVGSGRPAQRWSVTGGLVSLAPARQYPESIVNSINADGTVMVGRTESPNNDSFYLPAFVLTPANGTQQLSNLGSTYYSADAGVVTPDGNTILGLAADTQDNFHTVLWRRQAANTKQNQTITFTSTLPRSAAIGNTYTVSATASSGLAVSFSSSTSVCTVLGSTVKFIAAGTCTISANQAGNASYNAAPTVSQTVSVLANYTLNFNTLVAGKIVTSVSKGLGITTTGPITDAVPVSGVRNANIGNVAMVQGTRKLLILSRDGKSQIPYAYGGTMTFDFSTFGTGSVTVKSIKVNGMSKTGGTVKVYSGTTLLKSVGIPRLSSTTTRILTIGATDADSVVVTLTGAGKIDDLIVSQ